jgi:hypothetical protein
MTQLVIEANIFRACKWTDQSGQERYSTEVAMSMNFGPLVLTNIGPPSGV